MLSRGNLNLKIAFHAYTLPSSQVAGANQIVFFYEQYRSSSNSYLCEKKTTKGHFTTAIDTYNLKCFVM